MTVLFGFLEKGGPFMYIILAASIVGLAIMGEKVYKLWFRYRLNTKQFLSQITDLVNQNNYARAIEMCNSVQRHPLAQVMKAGLLKANKADKEIQRAMEAAMLRAFNMVQKRTGYVATIANVATLLGLLGTIGGLILAFESVASASAAERQEALAVGISVAMLTTAFGLIVAIPHMIGFAVLKNRENSIIDQVEESSVSLLQLLSARNREALARRGVG